MAAITNIGQNTATMNTSAALKRGDSRAIAHFGSGSLCEKWVTVFDTKGAKNSATAK